MATNIRIEPMTFELLPKVAIVAAKAFYNDPGYNYYFCDNDTRESQLLPFYQSLLWIDLTKNKENWVAMQGERLVGFICPTLPADPADSMILKLRSGLWRLPFANGLKSTQRLINAGNVVDSLFAEMPNGMLLLDHIGVDPEFHRQGVGTLMINTMMEKADVNGWDSYLVTQNPKNVIYYERFGFTQVNTRTIGDMPPFMLMRRDTEKKSIEKPPSDG
jgi:GNAT superfamily N-acetyltransferase